MNLYFENIIHDLQNADNEEILLILLKCLKLQKKWIKDSDLNYKLLLELSKHLHKDKRIFALLLRVRKQIDFMFPRWSSVDQKSARILIVNIFESPEASEEQISQALYLLHKLIRPVDNLLLRPYFSHKSSYIKALSLNCYLEVPSVEDIPYLFIELLQFTPPIVQIFSEIIKNGGRNQFFDYLIQMAQSSDLNQKIKLFDLCMRLQTSPELVQILKIFSQIQVREFKMKLIELLSFHKGREIDAILQVFLNDFDIDICEKAQEIKSQNLNKKLQKLPF
ncbi:hypothetical protein MJH12_18660 [bacterium]|nr:hypothetical protein [bacterium]